MSAALKREEREALKGAVATLAAVEDDAKPMPRPRFNFLDDVAIEDLPPMEWCVVDHVPVGGLCVLFAPPENLKSFFALALAFSVATGRDFFGHVVRRGLVVYIATEGSSGLPARVGAWKHSAEWYERAGVYFLTEPLQLLEPGAVAAFLAALASLAAHGVIVLIVIDTLARSMTGGDENSAKDMGIAIQAVDEIRRATNAAVMVVHHTRKDGDAERGSTSLRGAADSMISLKRDEDRLTVSCEKMKDAPHFAPYSLELIQVEDSCALVTAQNLTAVSLLMPGDKRHAALQILHNSSMEDGLSTSAWLKASGMKERWFYECRKFLVANGYVDRAPKRGAPNIISAKGILAVTADCSLTAVATALQQAAITACTSPSLKRGAAMQYEERAV